VALGGGGAVSHVATPREAVVLERNSLVKAPSSLVVAVMKMTELEKD